MSLRRSWIALVCGALAWPWALPVARAEDPTAQVPADSAASTDQAAEKKYSLAFKFEPHQILRYEVTTEQEITTTARDESEIQKNFTKARRHQRVTSHDDKTGEADLELTIDWVYMRALWDKRDGNKPVPIEFQSDDPEKQPEKFKHILATVGKPRATIRFSKTGNPLKVTTPNGKPVSNKTAANDTADGSREAHLIVLPEQPVAIGESWKERYDIVTFDETRNLTKVMFQRVYKLVAVTDGKAIIELKTMILSPGLSPPVLSQFLLAEVAGKITLDINRGLIVSKVLTAQNTVVNAIPGVSSQMKGTLHYTEKLTGEEQAATRAAASADVNSKK